MKFLGGRDKSGTQQWWDQVEEVPRAGLPDAEKMRKSSRKYRVAIIASIFLLPLVLLSNLALIASNGDNGEEVVATDDQFVETRPVAILAVQKWLSSVPSPLPGGRFVAWRSATVRDYEPPVDPNTGEPPTDEVSYRIETHAVTLSAPGEAAYTVSVNVMFNNEFGAVALGEPAIQPVVPVDDSWQPDPYPEYESGSPSDEVAVAVDAWAAAYTSGDPAKLRQAIGDGDASRSYVPLVGARFVDGATEQGWFPDGSESTMIVRYTAGIEWATSPAGERDELPLVSFDLLVQGANTAAPTVVAWGGLGSGVDLKAYSNAVTDREVSIDQTPDPGDEVTETGEPGDKKAGNQ